MTENANEGCCPSRSRISRAVDPNTPQIRRKAVSHRRSSTSDSALKTTAGKRGAPAKDKRSSPLIVRKLEYKKPSGGNVEATDLHCSSVTPAYEDDPAGNDKDVPQKEYVGPSKSEPKRSLFSKNHASSVVPYPKDDSEGTMAVSNAPSDVCRHHKDCEELSLIRKQLVQIENQQSSLMDLLQVISHRFSPITYLF